MNLLIAGGRVIDPRNNRDALCDLLVKDGKIFKAGKKIKADKNFSLIQAKGCWVLPGFIDTHVHFREPGGEDSETIESGSRAAAAGGVTSALVMANTHPPIDSPQQIKFVVRRSKEKAIIKIYPVGSVTKGLEGKELTDVGEMVQEGCKAVSDDGRCIMNSWLLRLALAHSKSFGIPLIEHCEDENLSANGVVNESMLSVKLGLRGIPAESESIIIARDAYLAQLTGAHIHCAHVSTADGVEEIRAAKKKGIRITAETCPHYFTLTENAVQRYNTLAKMKPPLRSEKDLQAVRQGLADGTIDIIATDHAPHEATSKAKEFSRAPFGIIGLETSFALIYNELIIKKILKPLQAIQKITENPAKIFNLPGGDLSMGSPADIAIFNPEKEWTYLEEDIVSQSSNSPFIGRSFKGKVIATIVNGRVVFQNGRFA